MSSSKSYSMSMSVGIEVMKMLQVILKQACYQLSIIRGDAPKRLKIKPWIYKMPEERLFTQVQEYSMEDKKKPVTVEEKLTGIYKATKEKYDKDLDTIRSVLLETVVQLYLRNSYEHLRDAVINFKMQFWDDHKILNTYEEEAYMNTYRDLQKMERKCTRFHHEKFMLLDSGKSLQSTTKLEDMFKQEYIKRWEVSRRELQLHKVNRDIEELKASIVDLNNKIRKDKRVHLEIEAYEIYRTNELKKQIVETMEKTEKDREKYERDILKLKMSYDQLVTDKNALDAEIKLREQQMLDYYEEKKIRELEELERNRLLEEEEKAQLEKLKAQELAAAMKKLRRMKAKQKKEEEKRRRA